jgi:NADPH:quinone reductase-like Zn-dependent oxidoreductase
VTGSDGVNYAIDPVGGDTGTEVFRSLAADGRLLVYGSLSNEPLRIETRLMIAGKRVVEGFWLGHWMRERSIPAALKLFHDIAALIRTGVLATELGPSFPLDAIVDAVREAEVVGRRGKVLLKIGTR